MIRNYKKSMIEPLHNDELHIFHSSSSIDRCIKTISNIIQDEAHGAYLIGGLRGVGKTSVVNLCCTKHSKDNLLMINLNCNKMINIDNFLYFFTEELHKSVKLIEKKLSDEIVDEVKNIYMKIINNYSRKTTYSHDTKKGYSKKVDDCNEKNIGVRVNIFNKLFNINNKYKHKLSKLDSKEQNISSSNMQEIEERNDGFILVERLSNVLRKIATYRTGYRIVITIDELDKHNKYFIEELFDFYKNLFLNSHIITFFVVDLMEYMNIQKGNEIENKLLAYFIKSIYIPTLEYEDVKNYMYREFEIKNYKDIFEIDYLTCGIFRKMNTYKYQDEYKRKYTFLKSILYHELTYDKHQNSFFERYTYDIYKIYVKDMIKHIFHNKSIDTTYITQYFTQLNDKYNILINETELIIDKLDDIASKYNFLDVKKIENEEKKYILIFSEKAEELELLQEYEMKKIKYELSSIDNYKINRHITQENILPITITEHKPEAFYYIIRFIETMGNLIDNVIIIEKVSNWNEVEVKTYSAVLVINKPIGHIIYTIDECSFSYEGPFTVDKLIEFMKENEIKIIKIETDDEPVEKNLKYIFKRADKIIYG